MYKKFEYKILSISMLPIFDREKQLNKYGKDGWELVFANTDLIYLKREITEIILNS